MAEGRDGFWEHRWREKSRGNILTEEEVGISSFVVILE